MAANFCTRQGAAQFAAQLRANAITQQRADITLELETDCTSADETINYHWFKIREVMEDVKSHKDGLVAALEQVEGKERAHQILTPDILRIEPTSYQTMKKEIRIQKAEEMDAMDPQAHIAILEKSKLNIDNKIEKLRQRMRSNKQPENANNNPQAPSTAPVSAPASHPPWPSPYNAPAPPPYELSQPNPH